MSCFGRWFSAEKLYFSDNYMFAPWWSLVSDNFIIVFVDRAADGFMGNKADMNLFKCLASS